MGHTLTGGWWEAPKGSILGPVLFYIFINNLEEETYRLIRWADKTKLRGPITLLEGRAAIQRDLNRMEEEANSKPVLFSKDTCKVQPWEGEMAGSDARWGQTGGAAALLKRCWGCDRQWQHLSPVCPVGKKSKGMLGGINSSTTRRLRELTVPFNSTLLATSRFCIHSWVTQQQPKAAINWSKFSRRLLRWSEPGALWVEPGGWGFVWPGEETGLGAPNNRLPVFMEMSLRRGSRFFTSLGLFKTCLNEALGYLDWHHASA